MKIKNQINTVSFFNAINMVLHHIYGYFYLDYEVGTDPLLYEKT